MCSFIGAQAQIDTEKTGGKNPLVELAQSIDIMGDPRDAELDAMRGEKVADDWHDDPRLAQQAADPAHGVEASNAAGSFEAFTAMLGGAMSPPPRGWLVMSYAGPEYWYVVYKAMADFGDLRKEAEKARKDLQDMADAAKATSQAESTGATQASDARKKDTSAIQAEEQALRQLGVTAKNTNKDLVYGGRNDMQQHLTDLQQELRYNDLLNRSRWLGFSTVQQATSYRQQLLNLAIQENKARFGGYLTPDQWLGYLQKEIAAYTSEAAAITARTSAIRDSTTAWLAHDNAVQGSSKSIGQLGENASAIGAYSDALNALPDMVAVKLELDDAGFRASLAADAALLGLLPRTETTRLAIGTSRTIAPAAAALTPGGADASAMAALARELESLVQRAGPASGGSGAFVMPPGPERRALPPGGVIVPRAPGQAARPEDQGPGFTVLNGLLAAAAAAGKYRDVLAGLSWSTRGLIGEEQIAAAQAYMLSLAQRVLAGDTGKAAAGIDELRAAWARLSQAERTARAGEAFGGTPPPTPPRGPPGLPPGGEPPAALPPGQGGPNPNDLGAMRASADALNRLRAAEKDAGDEANRTAADWLRMAGAADSAGKAYAYIRAAALAFRMEQAAGAAAAATAGRAVRDVAADIPPMVDGLVASTGGWFGLNSQLRLFGGLMPGVLGQVAAWHVLVDFIIEGLAVFVPALVTLAADLTAFGVAGYDAGKQVYDRIVAIHVASDALDQTLAPMTGKLEKLHEQVRPMVWQLYGDAIDVVHSKTGLFNQLAIMTGTTLDRLAAHVTMFALGASKGLETFFRVGNEDLAKLGTFFDNLGKALLALIKITQETHIDQLFLNFFVVLSQLLVLITKLPTPILAAAVALHAFWLWGGLAATVVMQLLSPLRALALALGAVNAAEVAGGLAGVGKDASAFERLKAGLTDIGAGLGALPGRLNIFSKAARDASVATEGVAAGELAMEGGAAGAAAGTDALAGGLGSLLGIPVIGWLVALAAALVGVGVYLGLRTNQTQAWIQSMDTALGKVSAFKVVGQTMADLAAVTKQLGESQRQGTGDTTELANAQADLTGKLSTELDHIGQVSHAYGTNMVGALALLNAAGVKTSDIFTSNNKVWDQALQQVRGLVDGYKAMGQGLSEIQRDVSVQLVLGSDQYTSMQKLNKAWDTFQQLTAGPFSGIVKVGQDLIGFAKDAAAAGASMTGLSSNSLTLQKDFQGTYTDVETLFSAIRSADAVTGDAGFSGAVKHAVQALLPLAGNNKAAAAEISQLAQEAGGPATTSLSQLAKWAGNTHDPLKALYQDSINATVGASNLDQDAARLTATLQSDLNPAMAAAAFNAMGGQKAFNTFAADLAKFGPNSQATITAGHMVATELLSIDKNSASAKAQFVGWGESMGLSRDAANKLWAEVSKGAKPVRDVQNALAGAAGAQAKLVKPGLWGQFEHDAMSAFDKIKAHPLTFAIAGAFNFIPGVTKGLDAAGSVITRFFGHTLPTLVTQTLPGMAKSVAGFFSGPFASTVQGAWARVWSALVSPVVHVFDDVKHAITSGFDGWWKTHGSALEAIWNALWGAVSTAALYIWHKIESDAKVFWNGLEGLWRGGASVLTGFFKELWGDLTQLARAFWQIFGPLVKSGWDVIAGIFRVAFSVIETIAKVGWDAIASAAKIVWAAIKAFLKITWDTIVAIFSVALDLLTGHWRTAWTDIKNYGVQVLNALKGFFSASWNAIKTDTLQAWNAIKSGVVGIWHSIENTAKQVWNNLKSGFGNVVSSIKTTWNTLDKIFRGPVSFLVNTVYDQGIARLWNDVMGAIGGPKLPFVKFAGGGRLPGYGGGDTVPAWIKGGGPALLEPGEAVVDKERTRKYAHVLAAMGVPGFAGGGQVPGDVARFGTSANPSGGNPLGSILSGIKNVLGKAFDVGKIMAALLSGNTTALSNALGSLIGPGSAHGELAQMITGVPRAFIHQLMTLVPGLAHKAKAAQGTGGVSGAGPVGGDQAVNKALARSMFPWDAGQWPAYDTLEMHEAGYNRFAHNPSGAYGLPQALPESKMPFAAQSGGGSHAGPQLSWMFSYIRGRYGTPGNAWAEYYNHPGGVGWYSKGGPVRMATGGPVEVPYLAGFHAGQAHNILVAAGLKPTAAAGQRAFWWTTGSSPRATTHVPLHSAVNIHASAHSHASGIRVPYLAGYTAGTAHNILAAEGLVPTAPHGQKAYWIVTGTRPGGGAGARHGMHVEILASAPKTPAPPAGVPKGMDPAQAWSFYSSLLPHLGSAEDAAIRSLWGIKLPKQATAGQRSGWAKDLAAMKPAQHTMGVNRNRLVAGLKNPAALTPGQWTQLMSEMTMVKNLEYGKTHPDWNWPAWHYDHPQWLKANQATASLQAGVSNAYKAWEPLYGPGGSLGPAAPLYNTPGVLVTPSGGQPSPVDLSSLIMGGPASPVQGGPGTTGFAGGGMVGGDGASLGQVASMFSLGGMVDSPALSALGLSPAAQRKLAGATAGEMPRSLSDAAGERVGVKVGNLTINNPTREETGQSITRMTNRLSFLAGRGAV